MGWTGLNWVELDWTKIDWYIRLGSVGEFVRFALWSFRPLGRFALKRSFRPRKRSFRPPCGLTGLQKVVFPFGRFALKGRFVLDKSRFALDKGRFALCSLETQVLTKAFSPFGRFAF